MNKVSLSNPFFSIIMPCYNSEEYLDYAVESVKSQSYHDWELIAINDGSTDSTLSMLEQYSANDKRIKVFSKQNGGYCSAVNVGLDNVRGSYFLFMGSDDALAEDVLLKIFNEVNDSFPDFVGFRTLCRRDGGGVQYLDSFTRFDSVSHENDVSIKEYEALHRNHSRIFFVRDTSKCFRTEKLENLRYYGKYGFDADGIFSMLFAHKCRSFMSIPIDGYYWTLRSDSVSGRKLSKEVYEDRLDNWMAFYKQILRMNPSDITTHERDYLDYCYEAVWKYASLINASDNKDKRLLAKYTRFIFFVMRRLKVSVGDTLSQRLMNYFYLFFPVYKIKSINRGT